MIILFFWRCVQHASVKDRQQRSFPAWLVSPLVRGPSGVALLGTALLGTWCQFAAWTVFLLLRWWRLGGQGLFFPLCPVQCLLHREPARNNTKWVALSQTQPTLFCPLTLFFPLTLWIDHSMQGLVAVGQTFLFQLFIHQEWSKATTQFQGWIWFSFCCGETTAH